MSSTPRDARPSRRRVRPGLRALGAAGRSARSSRRRRAARLRRRRRAARRSSACTRSGTARATSPRLRAAAARRATASSRSTGRARAGSGPDHVPPSAHALRGAARRLPRRRSASSRAVLVGNSIGGAAAIRYAAAPSRARARRSCSRTPAASTRRRSPGAHRPRRHGRASSRAGARGARWFPARVRRLLPARAPARAAAAAARAHRRRRRCEIAPVLREAWRSFGGAGRRPPRARRRAIALPGALRLGGARPVHPAPPLPRRDPRFPTARLETFAAGHAPHLETPEAFESRRRALPRAAARGAAVPGGSRGVGRFVLIGLAGPPTDRERAGTWTMASATSGTLLGSSATPAARSPSPGQHPGRASMPFPCDGQWGPGGSLPAPLDLQAPAGIVFRPLCQLRDGDRQLRLHRQPRRRSPRRRARPRQADRRPAVHDRIRAAALPISPAPHARGRPRSGAVFGLEALAVS